MRFTSAIIAAAALASSVLAQTPGFAVMSSPAQDAEIPAGSSSELIWTPGTPTGPITIQLLQGATPETLQIGPTLATGIASSGKFTFSAPTTGFKTYGFKISLASNPATFQYSFPFHVSGSSSSSSSASSAHTTGSATSSSASSKESISVISSSSSSASSTAASVTSASSKASSTGSIASTSATSSSAASVPTSADVSVAAASSSTSSVASSKPITTPAPVAVPTTKINGTTLSTTPSATPSTPAIVNQNAAVAKVASAGLALAGMLMAFAL